MANNKQKGGNFEREICKQLSLWWSKGKTDDIFWRTAGSGARATQRQRRGAGKTFGQDGDMQATNPIGQPFIDLFTVELKRGYKDATLSSLIDAPEGAKVQPFMHFIEQAHRSAKNANTPYWLIIHKKDRREAIIYYPRTFFQDALDVKYVWIQKTIGLKLPSLRLQGGSVYGSPLNQWLEKITPDHLKNLHSELKRLGNLRKMRNT